MAETSQYTGAPVTDLPEGFKMTELGPLPEEWGVVRLGEVVQPRNEIIDPSSLSQHHIRYIGLEHIDPGNPRVTRWGNIHEVRSTKCRFYLGDVLYGKLRPYLDKAVLAEFSGVCSTDILVLQPLDTNRSDPSFLVNVLHTLRFIEYAILTMTGVNHPRTSWKALSKLDIPLPPLSEQRAIAHVLRTVQKAKEATERVIQATRELKKSLMRHLFTYGPVPIGEAERVPLRETEIGQVPEHWEVQILEKIAIFVRDSINPSDHPEEVFDYYSIPAYQETGGSVLEVGKKIRSQKLVVEADDVLFGKLNPRVPKVLLVAASGRRKITSTEFIPLRATPRTTAEYLYYLCWSDHVMPKAQELISGSTPSRQRVDVKAFLSLPIPLPPLPEQREIARILQAVDKKLQAEETKKQALEALFKTLLHHLMTAQVRVKGLRLPEAEEVM